MYVPLITHSTPCLFIFKTIFMLSPQFSNRSISEKNLILAIQFTIWSMLYICRLLKYMLIILIKNKVVKR